MDATELDLIVDPERRVSALWLAPAKARAAFVFAHGAGAGMTHASMSSIAEALGERGVATLRYQFPYMQAHSKRPDPPKLCHATVRAAVKKAAELAPDSPLFAGGRSFGGRMTSQAQGIAPLAGVRGLIFVGFPLHPAGKPSDDRAEHLADVKIPMLFLQGTRDELAHLDLLQPVIDGLDRTTLVLFDEADHSFHVPARTGRKDADVRTEMADAIARWIDAQRKPKP